MTHICFNWGWYTILIGTSSYLEQVFDFNIKKNAIASVPLFTMWIFSVLIGKIFDAFCESEMMTTTMARKVATFIASVVPMICLLSLCFIKYSLGITGTILGIGEFFLFNKIGISFWFFIFLIAVTALGGMYCGFFVNHIDIAPHYAGTLMAITNTVATIPGIILPFFISEMTNGNVSFSVTFINSMNDNRSLVLLANNRFLENNFLCGDCILLGRNYCVRPFRIWWRGTVE